MEDRQSHRCLLQHHQLVDHLDHDQFHRIQHAKK